MKQRSSYFDLVAASLISMNPWKIMIFSLFLFYLNSLFWSLSAANSSNNSLFSGTEKLMSGNQFSYIFLGPFLETIVFQFLLLRFLLKYFPAWLAVVLSGVVFGCMHQYNVFYMMGTIVPGMFLSSIVYARGFLGNDKLYAVLLVYIIHALNNGITIILRNI